MTYDRGNNKLLRLRNNKEMTWKEQDERDGRNEHKSYLISAAAAAAAA